MSRWRLTALFLLAVLSIAVVGCQSTSSGAASSAPTLATASLSVAAPSNPPPSGSPKSTPSSSTAAFPTVPSDWTTYTSTRFSYRVDRPTDWAAHPAEVDWKPDAFSYPEDNAIDKFVPPAADPWVLMFVLAVKLPKGETTAERLAKFDTDNAKVCSLGGAFDVQVDGAKARQQEGTCFGTDQIREIVLVHGNRFYLIYVLSGGVLTPTTQATFDQFVESFRFL